LLASVGTASAKETTTFDGKIDHLLDTTKNVAADSAYDSSHVAERIEYTPKGKRTGRRFLCPENKRGSKDKSGRKPVQPRDGVAIFSQSGDCSLVRSVLTGSADCAPSRLKETLAPASPLLASLPSGLLAVRSRFPSDSGAQDGLGHAHPTLQGLQQVCFGESLRRTYCAVSKTRRPMHLPPRMDTSILRR
jgi:hypothetical protein